MKGLIILCSLNSLLLVKGQFIGAVAKQHSLTDHIQAIYQLDDQQCIPRLLCELASTSNEDSLTPQEKSVLKLFRGNGFNFTEGSLHLNYKIAINLGSQNKHSPHVCASKYATCPLGRQELMMIFNVISASEREMQKQKSLH